MFRQLQQQRRVQSEFHVTLIHRAMSSQHQDYWNQLSDMQVKRGAEQNKAESSIASHFKPQLELGKCRVHLERIVFDDRIMCFVVRLIPVEGSEAEWQTVNDTAHVTIGTANQNIKPKESNDLLKRWLQGGSGGQTGIKEVSVQGHVELIGSVRAVPSRS